jgi:hypothetical protein
MLVHSTITRQTQVAATRGRPYSCSWLLWCFPHAPLGQRLAASLPRVSGPLQEVAPQHGRWGAWARGRPQPIAEKNRRPLGACGALVSRTGKYPSHRVRLPDAVLFGRDEILVEVASDFPQRKPTGAILAHHSDHRLLGAVLHELVLQVVEAEGQRANPCRSVLASSDAEPVQSF